MKKLFICGVLIACSVIIYAQKRTSPSFRNYLKSKNSFPQYGPRVLNSPGKSDIHNEALTNGIDLKIDALKKFLAKEKMTSTLFSGTLAALLPNGNKLYVLPQDNMPCVKPGQSQFNMPVVRGNNELDKGIVGSYP